MPLASDIADRVELLEQEVRKLRTELEHRPERRLIAHTDDLPVVRNMPAGDIVARGSGSDLEMYMFDGQEYFSIPGTPNSVTPDMLHPSVAGDGLGQDATGALEVNVDGTTLEILSDILRIAASAAGDGLTGGGGSPLAVDYDNQVLTISVGRLSVKLTGITKAHLHGDVVDNVTIQGGAGSALAVKNSGVGPAHLSLAVVDGSTMQGGGGSALSVKTITGGNVADGTLEEKHCIAAKRETPSAGNTILNHDSGKYRTIHVDMTGGSRTCTVENGVRDGQFLTIIVSAGGAGDQLTLDNADANLHMQGDFLAKANLGHPEITLSWDAVNGYWDEITRGNAMGSDLDGIYCTGWGGLHSITAASGTSATGGYANTLTGNYVFGWGDHLTIAGDRSAAFGKYLDITAAADHALAFGYYAQASRQSELVGAYNKPTGGVVGDSQWGIIPYQVSTSVGGSATWDVALNGDDTYLVALFAVGQDAGCSERASYILVSTFHNDGGAGATQLGATTTLYSYEDDAAWNCALGTNGDNIRVTLTGDSANALEWTVTMFYCKIHD